MGIMNDADKLGQQIRAKMDAEKAAKKAAAEQGKAAAQEQQRHEEDKRQGMIGL
jgi:hypothetical protein